MAFSDLNFAVALAARKAVGRRSCTRSTAYELILLHLLSEYGVGRDAALVQFIAAERWPTTAMHSALSATASGRSYVIRKAFASQMLAAMVVHLPSGSAYRSGNSGTWRV